MNRIASIVSFSKKIAQRIAEKKNNFSKTTNKRGGSHRGHEQPKDADDIAFGVKPPYNLTRDMILSKFLGAQVLFWVWYNFRENGLIVLVKTFYFKFQKGLEAPHYEHALNDELSDDDEEFWEKNFEKETDQQIERIVQVYKNRDYVPLGVVPIEVKILKTFSDLSSNLSNKFK
jgi:hypothetical protein